MTLVGRLGKMGGFIYYVWRFKGVFGAELGRVNGAAETGDAYNEVLNSGVFELM